MSDSDREDDETLEAFDDLETAEEFAKELNNFLHTEIEKKKEQEPWFMKSFACPYSLFLF
jgi:hypothetical protein